MSSGRLMAECEDTARRTRRDAVVEEAVVVTEAADEPTRRTGRHRRRPCALPHDAP